MEVRMEKTHELLIKPDAMLRRKKRWNATAFIFDLLTLSRGFCSTVGYSSLVSLLVTDVPRKKGARSNLYLVMMPLCDALHENNHFRARKSELKIKGESCVQRVKNMRFLLLVCVCASSLRKWGILLLLLLPNEYHVRMRNGEIHAPSVPVDDKAP